MSPSIFVKKNNFDYIYMILPATNNFDYLPAIQQQLLQHMILPANNNWASKGSYLLHLSQSCAAAAALAAESDASRRDLNKKKRLIVTLYMSKKNNFDYIYMILPATNNFDYLPAMQQQLLQHMIQCFGSGQFQTRSGSGSETLI